MAARSIDNGLDDVRDVLAQHLRPALSGLEQAADAGDLDGVRAFAFELAVDAATVAVACPPPRARR
jgi:hypothetical protein